MGHKRTQFMQIASVHYVPITIVIGSSQLTKPSMLPPFRPFLPPHGDASPDYLQLFRLLQRVSNRH